MMTLKNTKDCLEIVVQLYGSPFSNWKRTRKYKESGNTVRDFTNNEGMLIKLVTDAKHNFIGVGLCNGSNVDFAEVTRELRKVAKTIKHCGDYGELWYQPNRQQVWWVAGDADCDPTGPTTPMSEIITKFVGVKSSTISRVFVETEAYPNEATGWLCLGKHGKVVKL